MFYFSFPSTFFRDHLKKGISTIGKIGGIRGIPPKIWRNFQFCSTSQFNPHSKMKNIVFETNISNSYKPQSAAEILLNAPTNVIMKTAPVCPEGGQSFLIDISEMKSEKDARCDGLGAYRHLGGKKKFKVAVNGAYYYFYRRYAKLKHDKTLNRIEDYLENKPNLCLFTYFFTGEPHPIELHKHGNAQKE